jgi:hypothetical protein
MIHRTGELIVGFFMARAMHDIQRISLPANPIRPKHQRLFLLGSSERTPSRALSPRAIQAGTSNQPSPNSAAMSPAQVEMASRVGIAKGPSCQCFMDATPGRVADGDAGSTIGTGRYPVRRWSTDRALPRVIASGDRRSLRSAAVVKVPRPLIGRAGTHSGSCVASHPVR